MPLFAVLPASQVGLNMRTEKHFVSAAGMWMDGNLSMLYSKVQKINQSFFWKSLIGLMTGMTNEQFQFIKN